MNCELCIKKRVLILDGAMGTMIQRYGLEEKDFGSGRVGCNDVLVLTRPDVIADIHRQYLEAGADIIETNSFNANEISLAEYGLQDSVADINLAAARIARREADAMSESTGRRRFVAGSMGPSNVSLSLPETAAAHGVDYSRMRNAYRRQAAALIQGGVDILLLETVFDTLNAKAAIAGIEDAFRDAGRRVPLMISVTLTEQGRTLSGQTVEAFVASIAHARPWSIGMNCGFGAEQMRPWIKQLRNAAVKILPDALISLHPNAGLPDELGRYTETPESMAVVMKEYVADGLDIIGGCCGTTPLHIRALSDIAKESLGEDPATASLGDGKGRPNEGAFGAGAPHEDARNAGAPCYLAGLEPLAVDAPAAGFLKIGERCNVAGSRKFLRLIKEGKLSEALEIASSQIAKGARVLDINMDDGLLDAEKEMAQFVTLLGQDLVAARVPLMVDSSDMNVIRTALQHIQGRPIVNSISLKEGEEKFLANAREIREAGAAVVVMAFDEEGQATDFQRRIEICERAYRLLTEKVGFQPQDIIFDPNILTIGTGMPDHDRYALDFLDAVEWIKKNLKGAKVSGGVSNLSFSFRGHNALREAMHAIFLEHAIARGMDMAIVNPSTPVDGAHVDPELRTLIEDLIFARRPDAIDRLLAAATKEPNVTAPVAASSRVAADASKANAPVGNAPAGNTPIGNAPAANALETCIVKGLPDGLEPLLDNALLEEGSALGVVNRRLMKAMQTVGEEFGAGRMFLPQVVRSAGVMKRAIDYLTPRIEAEAAAGSSEKLGGIPFVIATVKGDVHDIGKNIVSVILKCGGFRVIDLGVMVDEDRIIQALRENDAKLLGLSGLITPSLKEMEKVAARLELEGMQDVTLFVGGATTSDTHTRLKIAPLFSGNTIHSRDAALLPADARAALENGDPAPVATSLREADGAPETGASYANALNTASDADASDVDATESATSTDGNPAEPASVIDPASIVTYSLSVSEVIPDINWRAFLHTWRLPPQLATGDNAQCTMHNAQSGIHNAQCTMHNAQSGIHNAQSEEEFNFQLSTFNFQKAEAQRLIDDARRLLALVENAGAKLTARVTNVIARRDPAADRILLGDDRIPVDTPRTTGDRATSLSDYVSPDGDPMGIFAVTAREVLEAGSTFVDKEFGDEYGHLLLQSLADRLVEAATEAVHRRVHCDLWGLPLPLSIRPAVGYASLPDQRLVFTLDRLVDYNRLGVKLTENGALFPSSTTTGLIFSNPDARYI